MRHHLLVACLVLASAAAGAQTYRYVDPQGRTSFSDTPPPGRARDVSRTPGAATEAGLPFALQQAAANFPVTLYTSAECGKECKSGRDLLNARGVPFTEKMLQKPEEVEELKALVGEAVVPVVKVGKQFFRGYLADPWNNLLDLAGYPKTAPYGSKPSGGLAQ